jgi:hypothetical protein
MFGTRLSCVFVIAACLFIGGAHADFCGARITGTATSCTPLIAGQNINIGEVCFAANNTHLSVTYNINAPGWSMTSAHVDAGISPEDIPQTRTGNPIPGQFAYIATFNPSVTTYTFNIPLADVFGTPDYTTTCPKSAVVAAHADVIRKNTDGYIVQTETAWGSGSPFSDRGNWGMYTSINFVCCPSADPPPDVGIEICDTSFAKYAQASTCFLDIGFNRWGWTNGPLVPGTYTFDLYAGAGQCDVTHGYLVGTLTVVYAAGTATVTYTMNAPYYMDQTHLYVGNARLPTVRQGTKTVETVAPGQYPYQHDPLANVLTDTYVVTGLSGSIYVVAHAQVCHISLNNLTGP